MIVVPEPKQARLLAALVAACAGLLCGACQSLEQVAPPVAALPLRKGVNTSQLDHGRELYVTKCVKCHSAEPVLKYSVAEWEEIVVDMAEETNLSAAETAAVEAYVMAVLKAGPALKQSAPL